jgi:Ca2+-binding EF-hand superfamily protein
MEPTAVLQQMITKFDERAKTHDLSFNSMLSLLKLKNSTQTKLNKLQQNGVESAKTVNT